MQNIGSLIPVQKVYDLGDLILKRQEFSCVVMLAGLSALMPQLEWPDCCNDAQDANESGAEPIEVTTHLLLMLSFCVLFLDDLKVLLYRDPV